MINEKTTTQLKSELKEICEKYSIEINWEKYEPIHFNLESVAKKFKFKKGDISYFEGKLFYCNKYISSIQFYSKKYIEKKIIEFSENEEFVKFLNEALQGREFATIQEQLYKGVIANNLIKCTENEIAVILNEIERREKAQDRLDDINKSILDLQNRCAEFLYYSQLNK